MSCLCFTLPFLSNAGPLVVGAFCVAVEMCSTEGCCFKVGLKSSCDEVDDCDEKLDMDDVSELAEEGGLLSLAGATVEVDDALLRPKPCDRGPRCVSLSSGLDVSLATVLVKQFTTYSS